MCDNTERDARRQLTLCAKISTLSETNEALGDIFHKEQNAYQLRPLWILLRWLTQHKKYLMRQKYFSSNVATVKMKNGSTKEFQLHASLIISQMNQFKTETRLLSLFLS